MPAPLRRGFDYLAPDGSGSETLLPGARVRVPFRTTTRIGVIIQRVEASAVNPQRLKRIIEVVDPSPVVPQEMVDLLSWASSYYHHPIGEVFYRSLPVLLREGHPARVQGAPRWRLTAAGAVATPEDLARAPRQAAVLETVQARTRGVGAEDFAAVPWPWRRAMEALVKRGWIERFEAGCLEPRPSESPPVSGSVEECILEHAQREAAEAIQAARDHFQAFLLDGVTGSGKTEVYLDVIERTASLERQALVLIPEIGLTPQTVMRFRQRLRARVVVLHSALSDRERLCAWLMARDGEASVIIGTRSAVFVPLKTPGVIIVDEEHDLSYKQQDSLRYSARDLAVMRARRCNVPVVLGSATPSLESLANASDGRYRRLRLPSRAKGSTAPTVSLVDVRRKPFQASLSDVLLRAIAERLERGEQTLLFLNRRGYAPTLMCHDCGWAAECQRCDAHMVYHRTEDRLQCHHCAAQRRSVQSCPRCGGSGIKPLGAGTQRVTQALVERFPAARILRADRDIAARKGALEAVFSAIATEQVDILVGTQMVAKGHHFPNVTLVGILDADGGLFSADFRASERMAQLLVQVAGRAGRGNRPGQVLVQTHHPDHPLLKALIARGYEHFAQAALAERAEARLPPSAWMALVRAEAVREELGLAFLEAAKAVTGSLFAEGVSVLGPVAAPMARRAGRYRAQLLIESADRAALQRFLCRWVPVVESLPAARRVRWSLDVDPQEML